MHVDKHPQYQGPSSRKEGAMEHKAYIDEGLEKLKIVLETQEGLGLEFLNSRVPHRFTGVYEIHHSMMRNVVFYDKLGASIPPALTSVPLQDSFCQFVLRDGVFSTTDSQFDKRLDGHVYQGVMSTYYGVPLIDNAGQLFGTLCHFDTVTHVLSDEEFAFLQKAALLLPTYISRYNRKLERST